MAIYKEHIVDVELTAGTIQRSFLMKAIGEGDDDADRFGVRVLRNGEEVSLTGVSCKGYFIRADGETVVLTNGTISGAVAYVTLTESCYTVEGQFSLAIKLTGGGVTGTMRIVDGVVSNTTTGTIVDPGTVLPTIETLLEMIEEAVETIPQDYSALSAKVKTMSANELYLMDFAFTAGKSINTSGAIIANNARIATEDFYDITDAKYLIVTPVSGYRVYVAIYSTITVESLVKRVGWITAETRINVADSDNNFLRVAYASIDDEVTLTTADADKASVYIDSYLHSDVEAARHLNDDIPTDLTEDNFESGGISEAGVNVTNSNRIRTKGYIDVGEYGLIRYHINDGYRAYFYAYSSASQSDYISSTMWAVKDGIWHFPAGTRKIRACYATVDDTAMSLSDFDEITLGWGYAAGDELPDIADKTRWIAIGDSITRGVYSTDAEHNSLALYYGWVDRFAASMGYELTKMAVRGIGFEKDAIDPEGSGKIYFPTLIDRVVALPGNGYNLITVAIGINDYNDVATLEQIHDDVITTITRLSTRFPNARLVFITPFNACNVGTASSQWAYNHSRQGRTLKDIADTIKAACDSYGVECIYATNGFLFNTINIKTLLPDDVHPSFYAHTLIAKAMARYLIN